MASSSSDTRRIQAEDDEIIVLGATMPACPSDQPQQEQGQEQPQPRVSLTHEMLLHGVVGRTPDHGGVLAPTNPSALNRARLEPTEGVTPFGDAQSVEAPVPSNGSQVLDHLDLFSASLDNSSPWELPTLAPTLAISNAKTFYSFLLEADGDTATTAYSGRVARNDGVPLRHFPTSMPDVPITSSAPSSTDASTNGVVPLQPYPSSDTNATVPDVDILMTYQERDLDEGTYSLLFAPNDGGIYDNRYTGDCVCPTDTGHPAVDDRYAACIPGIDSWAIPSPITPTTTVHSDFGDDDGAELAFTPDSIPDDSLSVDGASVGIRDDRPFEGEAEAERARNREAKRVEVQREETVAEESDEMATAAPGAGYKRKRDGQQVHQTTGIDDEFSDDEVVKKTGPADRRRRVNGRNNDVYDATTSITPVPTAHSTRPKTIAPSEKESLEENGTEDSTSDSESDSRAVQRAEMGQEGRLNVDYTGTWVEGLQQNDEIDKNHTAFWIQDEKTGSWAWRFPCLQRDHRDNNGRECRRRYAQPRDLVRHVEEYGVPVKCDKCGAVLSRRDALKRHKKESCEAQDNKKRRPGR